MGVLGGLLIRQLPPHMRWGRYAGVLIRASFAAYFPLVMAMLSGNTAGFTKKTTTNAMVRDKVPRGRSCDLSMHLFLVMSGFDMGF